MIDIGIVLLAAGASRRMGQPKQLLLIDGQPLLLHTLHTLTSLSLPVAVVLGAHHQVIEPFLKDSRVQVLYNPEWEAGMGTSMQQGIRFFNDKRAVLFCVVDQPWLSVALIEQYLVEFDEIEEPENALIAAEYSNGRVGVPALIGCSWWSELVMLPAQEGARRLLRTATEDLVKIPFSKGDFDLDTPQDWTFFQKKWQNGSGF